MDQSKVLTKTKDYLYKNLPKGYSEEDVKKYFVEKSFATNSMNDVFKQIAIVLQEKKPMYKEIMFFMRENVFAELLFNFDPYEVNKVYNFKILNDYFYSRFRFKKYSINNNAWIKYTKGLLSAAKFLSAFTDFNEFNKFVNAFGYNFYSLTALPLLLEGEIHGLEFNHACLFLNRLGYINFPSLYEEINDIFKAIDLSDGSDIDTFKAIIQLSDIYGENIYEVDQVFKLVSLGDYYLQKKKVVGQKHELIDYLKYSEQSDA